jgi:hypothetical protein
MTEVKSTEFQIDDEVYVFAYANSKKQKEFFVCRAKIIGLPQGTNKLFKVQVTAVADRPVGGPPGDSQMVILGRTISKKQEELHTDIAQWFRPPSWLVLVKE